MFVCVAALVFVHSSINPALSYARALPLSLLIWRCRCCACFCDFWWEFLIVLALDYLHIFQQVHTCTMCVCAAVSVCVYLIEDCHTKPAHAQSAFPFAFTFAFDFAFTFAFTFAFALPTCCHRFATAFLNSQQFPSFPAHTHTHSVAFSVVLHLLLFLCFMFAKILHLNLSLAHTHAHGDTYTNFR